MSKVAIVTGASSGIGRETAIALSHAGWSVVIFARRLAQLQETQQSCSDPSKCLCFEGDVTNESSVRDLFQYALEKLGRVDLLFNNAGVSAPSIPTEEMSLETFKYVTDVSVLGTFLCTREAIRIFKAQSPRGGRIINNGSIAAHSPRPHAVAYTAAKHAISGLTKSTALDGRAHNITCTQIDIGNAKSSMTASQEAGILQPDGRVVSEATFDPKHVASTIVHVAGLPLDVTVLNVTIMATEMPFVGRG
ncbi:NAD(P)-binding protein [Panus rudis PR-1116 ss-1]|nr:NAD(P)-binding protein [Panus rudis PR-1116 ss-1]